MGIFSLSTRSSKSSKKYESGKVLICAIFANSLLQLAAISYIPALASITSSLKTNQQLVQISVTCYFFGYGLFSLFYGWLSDIYGRRSVLLISLFLFSGVSVLGFFISSISQLIVIRFLQGATLTALDAIWRAILCDYYSEQGFVRAASYIFMTFPIMMLLAPLAGGTISSYFNWHYIFILTSTYSLLVAFIIYWLLTDIPFFKTPPSNKRKTLKFFMSNFTKNLKSILKNPIFIGLLIAGIAANSSELAYNLALPYILYDQFGIGSLTYGILASSLSIAILLGAICINILSRYLTTRQGAFLGLVIGLIAGLLLLIVVYYKDYRLFSIFAPIFLFVLASQIIYANANAGAIAPFSGSLAGFAGGLQNSLQTMTTSVAGMFIAAFPVKNVLLLGTHVTLVTLAASLYLGFLLFTINNNE